MHIAASVLLVVLAVVGAVALLRELALRLFSGGDCGVLYVTRLPDDPEQMEFALRSALAGQRWGMAQRNTTVCVDGELSATARKICEGICRDYGFRGFISKEEFIKSLDYCSQNRV